MYLKRNKELEIISLYTSGYAKRFYLRQIACLAKIPVKTTQVLLTNLEKAGILKGRLEGKNKYFTLNFDNVHTKSLLLHSEIQKTDIFLETYPIFKTFLKSLPPHSLVVVFGSFARLKAAKDSDADIFTASAKEVLLPEHLLPYKIHHIHLTESAFINSVRQGETLVQEIEESHIILGNHSFYVDVMWGKNGR